MEGIFQTDVGKLRPHNEDNGAIAEDQLGQFLALVADGMGGHQAGDVASAMAMEGMLRRWHENQQLFSPKDAELWLNEAVLEVNKEIYYHSLKESQCEGMGTTLVAAVCTEEFVSFSNVGDSRIYMLEEDALKQMTNDHSLVGELVRSGQISEQEADHHPRKNVLLRALGTEPSIKVDVETISWKEEDILLLCSDGLTNKLSDDDIQAHLTVEQSLASISEGLINKANELGGEDNITITLIRHRTKEVSQA